MHERLENILPKLICSNQFGFLRGRKIIENVLLTHKVITDITKRGKPINMSIKLDIVKAQDRVS